MDVTSNLSTNASLAVSAYGSQQAGMVRPREQRNDDPAVDRAPQEPSSRRVDNVNFSTEALRLSGQSDAVTNRTRVNAANESETDNAQRIRPEAQPPETERATGAKSVAQAINAYNSTQVI
ncbi:MAG: hypothetical protein ACOZB0_03730 [Pseudomonadota bacterium]